MVLLRPVKHGNAASRVLDSTHRRPPVPLLIQANIPHQNGHCAQKGFIFPTGEGRREMESVCAGECADFSALAYFFCAITHRHAQCSGRHNKLRLWIPKVEGWIPKWKLDTYPEWDMDKEEKDPSVNEWERIGVMYNAMLKPVLGYTVKGFLWNQGESNVGRHNEYPEHQKDMVEIWREEWGTGELPFYFVELPAGNMTTERMTMPPYSANASIRLPKFSPIAE